MQLKHPSDWAQLIGLAAALLPMWWLARGFIGVASASVLCTILAVALRPT